MATSNRNNRNNRHVGEDQEVTPFAFVPVNVHDSNMESCVVYEGFRGDSVSVRQVQDALLVGSFPPIGLNLYLPMYGENEYSVVAEYNSRGEADLALEVGPIKGCRRAYLLTADWVGSHQPFVPRGTQYLLNQAAMAPIPPALPQQQPPPPSQHQQQQQQQQQQQPRSFSRLIRKLRGLGCEIEGILQDCGADYPATEESSGCDSACNSPPSNSFSGSGACGSLLSQDGASCDEEAQPHGGDGGAACVESGMTQQRQQESAREKSNKAEMMSAIRDVVRATYSRVSITARELAEDWTVAAQLAGYVSGLHCGWMPDESVVQCFQKCLGTNIRIALENSQLESRTLREVLNSFEAVMHAHGISIPEVPEDEECAKLRECTISSTTITRAGGEKGSLHP
ncbi:hypothetical protein Pelo_6942 [Pelomyxa schiedti]|nr:hypothetical protein Pelo_6942 [Pelomyxa schiedti]